MLLLGIDRQALLRLAPQLRQELVELVSARHAAAALDLASARRFDLIVVRHGMLGMPIDELFERLRGSGGRSSRSYALILTESVSPQALRDLAGERSRFANLVDFDVILSVLSRKVLGVAHRVDARLMVEIGLRMTGGRVSRFCQIGNLSESGLLVRTRDRPEIGTEVEVSFTLPNVPRPVHSRARVVRHTEPHEPNGVALAFVGLERAARGHIRRFVGDRGV